MCNARCHSCKSSYETITLKQVKKGMKTLLCPDNEVVDCTVCIRSMLLEFLFSEEYELTPKAYNYAFSWLTLNQPDNS